MENEEETGKQEGNDFFLLVFKSLKRNSKEKKMTWHVMF